MEKIPAVETAKELMIEAGAWSVMKWLREKKTVRRFADQANAALDQLNQAVKDRWPDNIRTAYDVLLHQSMDNMRGGDRNESNLHADVGKAILSVKKVKDADEEAHRARMEAEETFDIAEKQLSTALAREGCRRAIRSWELHEKAIRKAEALISSH